jgi:hypothetical protein
VIDLIKDPWGLLGSYLFKAYDPEGQEALRIPLNWLSIFFVLCLFSL